MQSWTADVDAPHRRAARSAVPAGALSAGSGERGACRGHRSRSRARRAAGVGPRRTHRRRQDRLGHPARRERPGRDCEPTESYSAGRFVPDAVAAVRDVHARRRVPLLVGGTMLYLRSLLHGLAPLPQADSRLRAELDARAAREGWPALHAELARLDPEAAARVAPTDSQRIQRALEVCYNTGRPISELQRATVSPLAGRRVHYWMLAPPRAVLHERIQRRFEAMMAAGFLEEVRSLRRNGALTARHPSMRAVGYRQLWAHLDGQYPLEEAVRRGVAATRQLAKRQLTWMRGEALGRWIEPEAGLSWNRDICNLLARLGL
ncbi:MAG: tRNA (adenosine(37)-N6)-dimethylallyltransferase MiaA [Gammaproteobacteria bacterium]|nr:MAG: tRNA (adenosine(37)-N6)-dimethylallyltransferase MiaA [Gammaproteobacteria bacterium]